MFKVYLVNELFMVPPLFFLAESFILYWLSNYLLKNLVMNLFIICSYFGFSLSDSLSCQRAATGLEDMKKIWKRLIKDFWSINSLFWLNCIRVSITWYKQMKTFTNNWVCKEHVCKLTLKASYNWGTRKYFVAEKNNSKIHQS